MGRGRRGFDEDASFEGVARRASWRATIEAERPERVAAALSLAWTAEDARALAHAATNAFAQTPAGEPARLRTAHRRVAARYLAERAVSERSPVLRGLPLRRPKARERVRRAIEALITEQWTTVGLLPPSALHHQLTLRLKAKPTRHLPPQTGATKTDTDDEAQLFFVAGASA